MNFLMIRGRDSPNEENGEYKRTMELSYGIACTIKMSHKGEHVIEGSFEYVIPPLERLWQQEGIHGVNHSRKDPFQWISLIRLPDFVKESDFEWVLGEATRKKKVDSSRVESFPYDEGLCAQCMYLGSCGSEPATIRQMGTYAQERRYAIDITDKRHYHETYLNDPRKTKAAKLKTVIRRPVRKV